MNVPQMAYERIYIIGGLAALLELKTRLLADKEDNTEEHARAWNVGKTEEAVVAYFISIKMLTPEESEILKTARLVRNKFLHGDFREAIKIVEGHRGEAFSGKSVGVLNVKNKSGEELLATLEGTLSGEVVPTPIESVDDEEGKLFGWLLQSLLSGALDEAAVLLRKAIAIIERVSDQHAHASKE